MDELESILIDFGAGKSGLYDTKAKILALTPKQEESNDEIFDRITDNYMPMVEGIAETPEDTTALRTAVKILIKKFVKL